MTKEQLISAGLTDAQAVAILALHDTEISGQFIPKHRFDEVNTELKTEKDKVKERDGQISTLKKFEGDAATLKATIDKMETDNKTTKEKYDKDLTLERKRNAVRFELLADPASKPHDPEMILGLLNLDTISVDESNKIVSGFKEQAEAIKKDKAFLFSTVTPDNKDPAGGFKFKGNPPPDGSGSGGKQDEASTYGKSMAQKRLDMMGIKPAVVSTEQKT